MTVDPDQIADSLPDQPLPADEITAVIQKLGWDYAPVVEATDNGVEFVRTVYCYDETTRRALSLRLTDGQWRGEVEGADVSRSQWLKVTEQAADAGGMELGVDRVEFDDGTVREFDE